MMMIYLDSAMTELKAQRAAEGRPFTQDDLYAAIMVGTVERVRPKLMTVAAIMAGLLPLMWRHGTGAEVTQPPEKERPRSRDRGTGEGTSSSASLASRWSVRKMIEYLSVGSATFGNLSATILEKSSSPSPDHAASSDLDLLQQFRPR